MSVKKKIWFHKFILVVSYCALMALTQAVRTHLIAGIIRKMLLGIAVILLIPGRFMLISLKPKPNKWQITALVLCSLGLYFTFRNNWIAFYKFEPIIDRLGKWWPVLIAAISFVGIACALPLLWKAVHAGRELMEKTLEAAESPEQKLGNVPVKYIWAALIPIMVMFQFYTMQYSILSFPSFRFILTAKYFLLNFFTILSITMALLLIVQRWRYAFLGTFILFFVWGVGNHFVYMLHGSPLFLGELANAATAFAVLGNYSFSLGDIPWFVIAVWFYGLMFFRTFWQLDKRYGCFSWKRLIVRVSLLAVMVYPVYTNLISKDAELINGFRADFFCRRYGFVCVAVADAAKTMHPVTMPEGYSSDALPEAVSVKAERDPEYPDVILILNETFCDLDYYTTLNADADYLATFYNVENAFFGHAVVPDIGGGTNNSEYELLTGFPFYLVGANAPFNYLNFNWINTNVVQYFKRLGYYSVGQHYYNRENYHRGTAYPALGFDESVLGPPEDLDLELYGRRGHMDKHYYRLMESIYEACPADQPRFMYLLTFQNHGGYTQNDASLDTVHALTNFGTLDDQVDEFLTSISMSAEAFAELTDYFSAVDRKVIICMAGDHAPSFIEGLPANKTWGSEEDIALRTVPYVVWSNYGLDLSNCRETLNLFGLVPQLMDTARLPISQYYRCVLDMELEYPVLLKNGVVQSVSGKVSNYAYDDPKYAPVKQCLYLAFNALNHGDDFQEAYYLPQ